MERPQNLDENQENDNRNNKTEDSIEQISIVFAGKLVISKHKKCITYASLILIENTLKTDENSVGNDALCLLDDVEAHKRNLHCKNRTQDVEGCVSNVQTMRITSYNERK